MNQLHGGHLVVMQDNFIDNIAFIELGEVVRIISFFCCFLS